MKKRHRTDFIAIHCSATQNKNAINAAVIRDWHVNERGWSDIGYHYVIKTDGTVENGRDLMSVGAHVQGYNSRSIGICLVGGVDKANNPVNNFTKEQFKSLRDLLSGLLRAFPNAVIQGHRDFPGVKKACPCFDVREWWENHKGD